MKFASCLDPNTALMRKCVTGKVNVMNEKNRKLICILENLKELEALMKTNPDPEIQEVLIDTKKLVKELLG